MTALRLSLRLTNLVYLSAALLCTAPGCGGDASPAQIQDDGGVDSTVFDPDAEATDADTDTGTESDSGADAGVEDIPLPADIRRAAMDLVVVAENEHVRVYARASSSLSEEDIAHFLSSSTGALMYNMTEMAWSESEIANEPVVRVVVLNEAAYNSATGSPGTYGVSFRADAPDGDALVLPTNSLRDLPDLDDTLAHEINHILTGRRAPNDYYIPWWTIEGIAIDMGSRYAWDLHHVWTGFIKPYAEAATAADATLTFERYDLEDLTTDLGQVGHDQAISGFFIEYLRVIHPHGDATGFPDVHVRILATMTATSDGEDFAASFATNFDGLALADAKAAYAAFLDSTASSLSARFAGTIFE